MDLHASFSEQGSSSSHAFRYNHEAAREGLAKYLVLAELTPSYAENPAFVRYCQSLNPEYRKVDRKTCRSDMFKIFKKQKDLVLALLSSTPHKIGLSSDTWEGLDGVHYLRVTAQWIDEDWILQKRVIGFQPFMLPYDSITSIIMSIVNIYGISDKIISISSDNTSTDKTTIELLTRYSNPNLNEIFHMKCICDIINLCVQDGLHIVRPHINNIKNCLLFIQSCAIRKQAFKMMCKNLNLKAKSFLLDVKTQWNSTYHMLKSCIEYKDTISMFCNEHIPEISISEFDWKVATVIMQFFEKFEEATNYLSSAYHPTTNLVLLKLIDISEIFSVYRYNNEFEGIILVMKQKFTKYFEVFPYLYCFGIIMDPRCQFEGCRCLIQMFVDNMGYDLDVDKYMDGIKVSLFEMYAIYEQQYVIRKQSEFDSNKHKYKNRGLMLLLSANAKRKPNNELNLYYEHDHTIDNEDSENFDLLAWWKEQGRSYPILSAMARDILTPPVSTVASKSAFNSDDKVLNEKRTQLLPETLEMLVCLKDWLDAEYRTQGQQMPEDQDSPSDDE